MYALFNLGRDDHMKRSFVLAGGAIAALCLLLAPVQVQAQSFTASLQGTVKDSTGAVVQGGGGQCDQVFPGSQPCWTSFHAHEQLFLLGYEPPERFSGDGQDRSQLQREEQDFLPREPGQAEQRIAQSVGRGELDESHRQHRNDQHQQSRIRLYPHDQSYHSAKHAVGLVSPVWI